ncbi:MAG: 3'-5' exonuclease, partial [Bacillota bacterium]
PEFAVMDPYRRRLIMDDIIRRVVEESLAADRTDFLREVVDRRGHGSRNTHLDLVRGIWNDSRRSPLSWDELAQITEFSLWEKYHLSGGSEDTWLRGGLEEGDADIVEDTVEDLLQMHRHGDATKSKKYPPFIDAFVPHWPRLRGNLRGPEAEAALEEILEFLPEKYCPKPYKPHIRALHDLGRRCDLRRELAAAREMLDIMREIDRRYGRAKGERGALDFDDLQWLVLRVLEHDAGMRSLLQSRYTHLLVDEFQDTDEVQWSIARGLRGDGNARPVEGGGLFVVGDADQSIYRFRGADVRIFRRAARELTRADAKSVHLDTNFRSSPELVELSNRVFSRLFSDYRLLSPAPKAEPDRRAPVEFLSLARPKKGKDRREFRRRQGEVIAERIVTLLREGVKPGDVAILGRKTASVEPCARALAARGIPHRVVGGRGFFESEEIGDLKALLYWLADPGDDLSLAVVLRSPLFSFDDDLLYRVSEAGTGTLWERLASFAEESGEEVVRACVSTMNTWLRWSRSMAPADLIANVLETSVYREVLSQHLWADGALANLRRAVTMARRFNLEEGMGIGELARHLDVLERVGAEEESSPAGAPEDEVILSTIHKAKGLEFDTVIVPDSDNGPQGGQKHFLMDSESGLILRLPDRKGAAFSELEEREKELDREEEMRIFYVACTRAERRLILVGGGPEESPFDEGDIPRAEDFSANSYFRWYAEGLDDEVSSLVAATHLTLDEVEGAGRSNASSPTVREDAEGALDDYLAQASSDFPAALDPGSIPPGGSYSVTSLVDYLHCPRLYLLRHRLGWPEMFPVGREESTAAGDSLIVDPMTLGTLVHRACELLLDRDVESAVTSAFREASLAEDSSGARRARDRVRELVNSFAASALFAELSDAYLRDRALREWGFVEEVPELPDRYITGKIDALYRDGEEDWWVLDYKSDRVDPEEVPRRAGDYRYQLDLYRWVVRRNLGPVAGAHLFFLHPGIAYPISLSERSDRPIERAREIICSIESARGEEDFPAVDGKTCGWCGFYYHCAGR